MGNQDYEKYDVYEVEIATSSGVAYASGDVIGGQYALIDYDATKPIGGEIIWASLVDKDVQAVNVDLAFSTKSSIATTYTDNAAASISGADSKAFIPPVHLVDHTSLGSAGISAANDLRRIFRLRSNGDQLNVVPISRGAPTYTSVTSLLLRLGIIHE